MRLAALVFVLFITSCGRQPVNPEEWTFCECDIVHKQLKGEINFEKDSTEKSKLEMELDIVLDNCKQFFIDENSSLEERAHYSKQTMECDYSIE